MRARALLLLLVLTACGRDEQPAPASFPAAEFVIAAADSVYWVRSGEGGISVRGAPMQLALVGGRFSELYVTDEDRSFYDAIYVAQRLYKRDLITGDSVVLFADTLISALARSYAAANPDERPLAPDEEGNENPRTIATAEVLVLDVMGPWLSYEYRTDIDVIGGRSSHGSRRGVVDLRTGTAATLDAIFGGPAARALAQRARAQWAGIRDSMHAAVAGQGEDALAELDRLAFDATSFTLGVQDRDLLVRFAIVQTAGQNAGGSIVLDGIPPDEPSWWEETRRGYPIEEAPDERTWPRRGVTLVARNVSDRGARVAFSLRDPDGKEWRLPSAPAPLLRVMWVDDSTLAPGSRTALTRAFNEAAFYSDRVRVVHGATPRGGPPAHVAALPPRLRDRARADAPHGVLE
jgi:hypothetical protein